MCAAASSASGMVKQPSHDQAVAAGGADGLAGHVVRRGTAGRRSSSAPGRTATTARAADSLNSQVNGVTGQPDPAAGPAAQAGFGQRDGQAAVGQVVRGGQQPGGGRRGQQPGQPPLVGQPRRGGRPPR